jgi:transcription initiation factor TFIIIB Brf1 subunit/transcription initiation factor TFIIB
VNPKKLSRDYRTLLIRLGLTVPMLSPKDFVMKYSQHLPISQETRKLAVSITETIEKSLIRGKSPCTVAATVVYIACKKRNETVTQEQIAEAFGITAASIRNCMKLLCKSPKDC